MRRRPRVSAQEEAQEQALEAARMTVRHRYERKHLAWAIVAGVAISAIGLVSLQFKEEDKPCWETGTCAPVNTITPEAAEIVEAYQLAETCRQLEEPVSSEVRARCARILELAPR